MPRMTDREIEQNIIDSWNNYLCKQDQEEIKQTFALKKILKILEKGIDKKE